MMETKDHAILCSVTSSYNCEKAEPKYCVIFGIHHPLSEFQALTLLNMNNQNVPFY